MKRQSAFEYEDGEVRRYIEGEVAVIKLRGNVFGGMTDLESIDDHFSHYDVIENDETVKGLLIVNEHGIFGEDAYRDFLTEVSGQDLTSAGIKGTLDFDKWIFRTREIRILQRLVLRLLDFNKICICGLQGTVVTPFFGWSLAADFRFASEDMCFSLSHVEYGLQPSGGLVFFLPRYVGQGKAFELLCRGGRICAEEALDLGLITAILPKEDFELHCVEEARKLADVDQNVLKTTKHLFHYYRKALQEYFTKEADFVELKGGYV